MQIYLARNNQQAGPYSLEQINQMLASQQVLLTDLAWHQGLSEWKALGELTQGKLVYEPVGYSAAAPTMAPFDPKPQSSSPSISKVEVKQKAGSAELASFGSRFLAKALDLLLWFPAFLIPAFFLNPNQLPQLVALQEKMQTATTSDQAMQVQTEVFQLVLSPEALIAMLSYVLLMLALQAFLLFKSGQSIGKKITGIKIVDADSNSLVSLNRVFILRSMIFIILNFSLMYLLVMPFATIIDYVFALNPKRQTLHDKLAKTKVIKL